MPTVSAGSSAVIDVEIGQKIAVSTPGEAYVDVVAGALGAGYTSKRLADNAKEQTFGPYGMVTRLNIRAIVGTATYGEAAEQVTSGSGGAVASVNMKVGNVELTAADVGALPAPYAIGAVRLDGANSALVNAALSCVDTGEVAFSYWYRAATDQEAGADPKTIFVVDAANNYLTKSRFEANQHIHTSFTDATNDTESSLDATISPALGTFHHVLCAVRTNAALGSKWMKLYVDDVDVSVPVDSDAAFIAAINGLPFNLGDDGYGNGAAIDLADFWLSTEPILNAGDIPQAVRRKFIDAMGNPVPLGENGELPTGTAPAIFLHREAGADASTFVANRGTGGSFALTGTLAAVADTPKVDADIGFNNPMTAVGDLIIGGTEGTATRLANPGAGTFALHSVDGVLTWVAV